MNRKVAQNWHLEAGGFAVRIAPSSIGDRSKIHRNLPAANSLFGEILRIIEWVLFLVAIGILLSGCDDKPTITPVDPRVLQAIVAWFVTRKGWDFARRAVDRHKGFFVRRRAQYLGERNASWVGEADQPTLKARVESELTAVEAYLTAKLGTSRAPGSLMGGSGSGDPPHLDLADVARRKTSESATSRRVRQRTDNFLEDRKRRITAIVWRATALHDDLWQPSGDRRSATLRRVAMDEILDRRLRTIERMSYNVSRASAMGGASWNIAGATGPWRDGFRVRMFEYPRVQNNDRFRNAVGAGNIAPVGTPEFSSSHPWRFSQGQRRLEYNVPPSPGIRLPTPVRSHWRQDPPDTYRIKLIPSGLTPAQVITQLFTPNEDWWQRSWLFCDHVIAALHIEALWLGKKRREGNDNTFNAIVTNNDEGYVSLWYFVGNTGAVDVDVLMADNNDPHFQNMTTPISDLEVGDHLIFWNSFVYELISSGDWRLENALVMDIDSDPNTGSLDRQKIALQGHGTTEKIYSRYIGEIAHTFREGLADVQAEIERRVTADGSVTAIAWRGVSNRLVRWSPYETFNSPGAWWVRVPFARWGSADGALEAIPKSVKADPSPGSGYSPPPFADSVYFPIYEPRVENGWQGYLTSRRADPAFRAPRRLRPVRVDGRMMPGLFYRGERFPIPIIRPKVTP